MAAMNKKQRAKMQKMRRLVEKSEVAYRRWMEGRSFACLYDDAHRALMAAIRELVKGKK